MLGCTNVAFGKIKYKEASAFGMKLWRRFRSFVLSSTVQPLIGLFPRTPRRWVFGHRHGSFAGNPKYLFLWVLAHNPEIHATWITSSRQTLRHLRDNGLPVRARWSLPGIIAMLRSGVFAYAYSISDISFQPSLGAFRLNLWHGVGVKALAQGPEWVSKTRRNQKVPTFIRRLSAHSRGLESPDVVVTTSDFTQRHFAKQFRIPFDRCPQLGYPRLDCAYDNALDEKVRRLDRDAGFELNPRGYSEVYLYMPTFRDSGRLFLAEAIPDPKKLSLALAKRDALLYIKLHHLSLDEIPETDNIQRWPDEIDFQPYLSDVAGLITDYSSVLYDYLLVNNGAPILYVFDLNRYRQERTLSHEYENNVGGLRVENFDELCQVILDGSAATPALDKIASVRDKFWGGSHRPASPAIINDVFVRIGLQ